MSVFDPNAFEDSPILVRQLSDAIHATTLDLPLKRLLNRLRVESDRSHAMGDAIYELALVTTHVHNVQGLVEEPILDVLLLLFRRPWLFFLLGSTHYSSSIIWLIVLRQTIVLTAVIRRC